MIEHKCDRCKEKIDWGQRVLLDAVDAKSYKSQCYELCPTCYSAFKENFLHDFDGVLLKQQNRRVNHEQF